MHAKNQNGFSLLELLFVIGAIAVITTLSVVSFNSARLRARDAQRVHDIKEIRTALELYYNRTKTYPTSFLPGRDFSYNNNVYISPVPSNPLPQNDGGCASTNYAYAPTASQTDYNLVFCLGADAGEWSAGDNICTAASCNASTGPYDAEAQLLFGRFTGTLSGTDKTYISTLISAGKSHGWWGKLDLFYVFAIGTNSTDALLNWKSSGFTATNINSMSWTAYQGFTGNGTNSYLDTAFNGSTDAINYQRNSSSYAVYVRTNVEAVTADIGAANISAYGSEFFPDFPGLGAYGGVSGLSGDFLVANTDTRGFWNATRTASTTSVLYRNGSSFTTSGGASTAVPSITFYIGASHRNTSANYFSTRQIAVAAIGGALTASEAANFAADVNAYMTSIGTNVY